MSLAEKSGQLVQTDFKALTPGVVAGYRLGSVLAGGTIHPPGHEDCTSPFDCATVWADFVDSLQDEALNMIDAETEDAKDTLRNSIEGSKDRFMEYTVTTEEAKQEGGLTEDEVNELFQGGE